jgi:hypothetical protein
VILFIQLKCKFNSFDHGDLSYLCLLSLKLASLAHIQLLLVRLPIPFMMTLSSLYDPLSKMKAALVVLWSSRLLLPLEEVVLII